MSEQAAHGQDIHSIQTAAAAARDEVNLAKAAYTRAIQELEGYGKIEPSMKTELEQSCVRYHELLFQATQQQAMSGTLSHDLEKAFQDMDSVMHKVADDQVQTVTETTANYLLEIVQLASERTRWIHYGLCLFVAEKHLES